MLLFVLALIYGAFTIAPIYIHNYELEGAARDAIRKAQVNERTPEDIRADLYHKAQELGVPVDEHDIKVRYQPDEDTSAPPTVAGEPMVMEESPIKPAVKALVEVEFTYTENVNLPGFTIPLYFHFHADDRSI